MGWGATAGPGGIFPARSIAFSSPADSFPEMGRDRHSRPVRADEPGHLGPPISTLPQRRRTSPPLSDRAARRSRFGQESPGRSVGPLTGSHDVVAPPVRDAGGLSRSSRQLPAPPITRQ